MKHLPLPKGEDGRTRKREKGRSSIRSRASAGVSIRSIVIALSFLTLSLGSLVFASSNAAAYTPHLPILIEGNSQFTLANGVTGGSGAPGDPYVIEGWSINATTTDGITIRNTTAHFSIRRVYVYSDATPSFGDGVVLKNLTNGKVESSLFEDYLSYAIYADDCTDCEYIGNTFQRRVSAFAMPQRGVYLNDCYRTVISSNNFTWTGTAVMMYSSPATNVSYNNITGGGDAITFSTNSNNSIAYGNNLSGITTYGITTWMVNNVTVASNNIINGNYVSMGAYLSSSNITFSGNTVDGAMIGLYTQLARDLRFDSNEITNCSDYGICVDRTTSVTMSSNDVWMNGITLMGQNVDQYATHSISSDNLVNGMPTRYLNGVSGSEIDGEAIGQLIVASSDNVTVSDLNLSNTDAAMQVAYSRDIVFENSDLSNASRFGALINNVKNLMLSKCDMSGSHVGLSARATDNASIAYNEISYNSLRGVEISTVTNSVFLANRITNNTNEGVFYIGTWISANVEFSYNEFSNNLRGIYLQNCPSVRVHHNNFVSNAVQALDNLGATTLWNESYPSGGNSWSDYSGVDLFSGPNQDLPGSDGIGDTPYTIDGDSIDYYPLMNPVVINTPPEPRFSVDPGVGNVSTTFLFDASESSDDRDVTSALEVRWDWTDDGTWDTSWSTTKTATHLFSSDGVKTVRLEVRDTGGLSNNTTATVVVDSTAPDTSAEVSGTIGDGGWYRSDVTITLTADDNLSGVNATAYRIDSGEWQSYSGSFVISDNGEHDVEFYSVDAAGNEEGVSGLEIDLDKEAGTLLAVYPTNGAIVRNATPTITVLFDDSLAQSGLYEDSISISIDSQSVNDDQDISQGWISVNLTTPLDDGWHQLSVYVEDLAGNVAVLGVGFLVNTSEPDDGSGTSGDLQDDLDALADVVSEIVDMINSTQSSLDALTELVDGLAEVVQNLTTADDDSVSDLRDSLNDTQASLDDLNDQLEETKDSLSSDLNRTNSLLLALFALIVIIAAVGVTLMFMIRREMAGGRASPKEEDPPPPVE